MNYADLLIVIAENTQTVEDSYTITTAVDKHIESLTAAKPIVSGSLPLTEPQLTELASIGGKYVYEGDMGNGRISELGIMEIISKYEEFKRQ